LFFWSLSYNVDIFNNSVICDRIRGRPISDALIYCYAGRWWRDRPVCCYNVHAIDSIG